MAIKNVVDISKYGIETLKKYNQYMNIYADKLTIALTTISENI